MDIAGNANTTASLSPGDSVTSTFDTAGDFDWFAVDLVAGVTYEFTLEPGAGNGAEEYGLYLTDEGGVNYAYGVATNNNDATTGETLTFQFTVGSSGRYYIEAWDAYSTEVGETYTVSMTDTGNNLVEWTNQEIADYLTDGGWEEDGLSRHIHNVGADGQITFDVSAMGSAVYKDLARAAFEIWGDIAGIEFVEITGSAEIEFTDNQAGAYASGSWNGAGYITSMTVNVSTDWITNSGTEYTFQTFLHEIGHALGLGHSGHYDGSATYGIDNGYLNDSWAATVMSYFSQQTNTYVDADFAYLMTPMHADILAIQELYGVGDDARTGNDTYGFNATNAEYFDFTYLATNFPGSNFAGTLYDNGGIDTVDLSAVTVDQTVDLAPGSVSSVGGVSNNIYIDYNTIIENVIGGSAADNISGNDADNDLRGMGGNDTIEGGIGNDSLYGGSGGDHISGGEGNDTAYGGSGLDTMFGGAGDDTIQGNGQADTIRGGEGEDFLVGGNGNDIVYGDGGDDTIIGANDNDTLHGGAGNDELRGQQGADVLNGNEGNDTLIGGNGDDILRGGDGADTLKGELNNDTLYGGAGNDILEGGFQTDYLDGGLNDDHLYGGGGNDTLIGNAGFDNLYGGSNNDKLYGGSGNDFLDGGAQADELYGGTNNDTLQGGSGNDLLYGETGNDSLLGGLQNDVLDGGAGNDILTGGGQFDTFVFGQGYDQDTITDFQNNVDTIDLSSFGFSSIAQALSMGSHIGTSFVFDFGDGDTLSVLNATQSQLMNDISIA